MNGRPVLKNTDEVWEELYQPDASALPPPPRSLLARRKKRLLAAILVCLVVLTLAFVGAGASFLIATIDLYADIQRRDGRKLEAEVDWPLLQRSLRQDLTDLAGSGVDSSASSAEFLNALVETTIQGLRQPEQLARTVVARTRSMVGPGALGHLVLTDILDWFHYQDGGNIRIDLPADSYAVVSGVSLCFRPTSYMLPKLKLSGVGWPEIRRHC